MFVFGLTFLFLVCGAGETKEDAIPVQFRHRIFGDSMMDCTFEIIKHLKELAVWGKWTGPTVEAVENIHKIAEDIKTSDGVNSQRVVKLHTEVKALNALLKQTEAEISEMILSEESSDGEVFLVTSLAY
jgi:hypothetical protein